MNLNFTISLPAGSCSAFADRSVDESVVVEHLSAPLAIGNSIPESFLNLDDDFHLLKLRFNIGRHSSQKSFLTTWLYFDKK